LAPIATNVNQSICEGETYSGHSAAGVYTDKFTSINGCDSVRTLNLTVIKKVYTTVDHAICDGETFLGYKVAGSYKDVFVSQYGCDSIRTLNLSVNPRPVAIAGTNAEICFGDEVHLSASGGESYFWSPSTYLNNPNISDPLATPEHTISYSVSVKDINGCTSNPEQVTITVIKPQVFAGKDTAVMANQPVQLFAGSLGNTSFVRYNWSPAFGLNDPNAQNPIASIDINTTYILTAYTANGCKATDAINIQIFKELKLTMPNAFTPNGDGKNDIFRPLGVGIKSLSFRIYSRWGALLFSTTTLGQGWDGTYQGAPQNAGNYIWQINGVDFFGNPFSQNGSFVLIR
jgi:gliding motility-associated-like protein